MIFFLFGFSAILIAQEEGLNPESDIEYTFGQELLFSLNVQNASDVQRITLFIRPELSTDMYVVNVPFEPAETLSVTHPIDVSLVKLLPFSKVTYSWQVETTSGPPTVLEQSFTYEDDRFFWQTMTQGGATAHWTGNGPSFGQDTLNVVNEAVASLTILLSLERISPFDIYVYPSSADLRTGLRRAGLEDDKMTHPELGVILVTAVNPQSALADLSQSIPYELAHLLIFRVAGERYQNVPWWFIEGLGTIIQAEPHPRDEELLDAAIRSGTTIPLKQLCDAPLEKGDAALLAGAQSASLVDYILQRYGAQLLAGLISNYASGSNCQSGIRKTMGMTIEELEVAWLAAQQESSAPVQFLTDYGLWLLILLASLGLTGMIIWRTTRHRN